MSGVEGTLGGYVLDGFSKNGWTITPGVSPSETVVFMERNKGLDFWQQIGLRGAPISLRLGPVQYDNVYAVSPAPGADEDSIGFRVQDVRWLWPRARVVKHFNVRKRTGDRRLVGDGRIENQQSIQDVAFKAYSLRSGIFLYTLEDVLRYVLGLLGTKFGHDVVIPPGIASREFPIENFRIDAQGDDAVGQILAKLGGLNVTVRPDGFVTVIDPADGSEADILASRPAPFRGTSTIEFIDRRIVRPSAFRVLIENEPEIRMDGAEPVTSPFAVARSEEAKNLAQAMPDLVLENVLQVPDIEITVRGQRLGQHSWVSFTDYLTWLAGEPVSQQNTIGPPTLPILRENYLRPWFTQAQYEIDSAGEIDPVWRVRWQAMRKFFRVAWRPIKLWRDRFRRVTPFRVGIWDAETGTRAPASIYADYTQFPARRLVTTKNRAHKTSHGFVNNFYNQDLVNARQAPVDFHLLDQDNGIFRFYLVPGPQGDETKVIPGLIDGLSNLNPTSANVFGMLKEQRPLASGYNVASVFTVLQGGDNFHTEFEVKSEDLAPLLGKDFGDSRGPVWEIKIEPSAVSTARYAWDDKRREEIKKAFLTPVEPDGKRNQFPLDLLVNREHCENMARAAGAVVLSRLVDTNEGSETGPANPEAVVGGAITSVTHAVSGGQDLTMSTTVTMGGPVTPLQLFPFLPFETQQEVRSLVI